MNKIEDILNFIEGHENSAFFYTPLIYKNSFSYIFNKPKSIITCYSKEDTFEAMEKIDKLCSKGFTAFGLINYEAGFLFEDRTKELFKNNSGLEVLKILFFDSDNVSKISSSDIDFTGTETFIKDSSYEINNFHLNTSKEVYLNNVRKIKDYIREGDTYQVNYTVKGKYNFKGSISALFLNLIFNQSAEFSAFINLCDSFVLSASPELFFKKHHKEISVMPMKGTIARGYNPKEDLINAEKLSSNKKDRAENVMIADLLRNDLGKISSYDSVNVESLFVIQKYESVFQATSSISSQLKEESISSIIKNIFPCGSITGAPKLRTMKIISELESEERGLYTGSIGIMNNNNAVFNIGIRTLKINKKDFHGELGIGSGIVWDSDAEKEFDETNLKAKFLTNAKPYFDLFETMLVENGKVFLINYHIARLENAADFLLFNFNKLKIENTIIRICSRIDKTKLYRLKLFLTKWGHIKTEIFEYTSAIDKANIIISSSRINSHNTFQYFKTTNKELYNRELKSNREKGFWETIYLNEKNEICEGTITNIFIKKNNIWCTPLLDSGILNGCYRKYLLENKHSYSEQALYMKDLLNAEELLLTNSLRKEIKVRSVTKDNNIIKKFT